ncbi:MULTISPECIES: hypothetical protein [Neobacillus]|jgi:hypothetical protein|uniref:Uncharacterized protein n=2 Tax=Neobacillus TaxID=2675232 RepID=A0A6B3TLX9_9BACI|nr:MULTISPECIES: hypothetical protein [Neobacillus]AIM17005.1 hypothetical protein HW35_12790 [Bacillus sp. X1(2014)]MCD4839423.1 hypothetical protein [Neobacillus sedimentimangrovi]MED3625099.1 hypothetical protein [Neobacillus thermocopriae]MED3714762.1 hypothetical protein [Neobacillus thermocopriae]NEX77955.1 hypothetical protein [Neobacillus thermocopriae]
MVKDEERSHSKNVVLAVFDTVTLGIPVYIANLIKQPKKTLKISLIVIPIVAIIAWFLSSLN